MEGMCAGKPVLCYLRDDLLELAEVAGLLSENELPIINCTYKNVKAHLRELLEDRDKMRVIGSNSRLYIEKHHSFSAFSRTLLQANLKMGLPPSSI